MAFLGLGLGMIISAMTTRYRDLAVPGGIWRSADDVCHDGGLSPLHRRDKIHKALDSWVIEYNPMTPIIETFRIGFLGSGTFTWGLLGYATGVTFVLLILGILAFNKVERTFVDTI